MVNAKRIINILLSFYEFSLLVLKKYFDQFWSLILSVLFSFPTVNG